MVLLLVLRQYGIAKNISRLKFKIMLKRNTMAFLCAKISKMYLVMRLSQILPLLLFGGLFFLSGCSTQAVMLLETAQEVEKKSTTTSTAMTTTHEAVLLITARSGKDAAVQRLRLTWARLTASARVQDIIEVKGVLGNTRARFEIVDDAVGKISLKIVGLRAEQESEARRALALLPPPRSLGYWLSGKPDPAYSAVETLAVGAPGLSRIVQHGWEVQYESFDTDGRPLRLMLREATAVSLPGVTALDALPPPEAEVLVEIKQWLSDA